MLVLKAGENDAKEIVRNLSYERGDFREQTCNVTFKLAIYIFYVRLLP